MYTYQYIDLRNSRQIPNRAPRFIAERWDDDVTRLEAQALQRRGWYVYTTLYGAGHRMEHWTFAAPAPLAIDLQSLIPTFDTPPVFAPSKLVPFYSARFADYAQTSLGHRKPVTVIASVPTPTPQTPVLPAWASSLNTPVQMVQGKDLRPGDTVYFTQYGTPVRLRATNGDNGRNQWGEYVGWTVKVLHESPDGGYIDSKRQINPARWFVVNRKVVLAEVRS